MINSPKHQLSLQISQDLQIAGLPAQVGGGLQHTSRRNGWVGFDFDLPKYTTVRLFGEIEPVENLTVRVDLDNLFDETFYTNSFADVWVQPGTPRWFRVSATYSF